MKHRYLFSAAIATVAMVAAAPTFANDVTLDHAIEEVRAQTGGTLVSIQPHAGGRQLEAVFIDPNGVVQSATYSRAASEVESIGPARNKDASLDAKNIRGVAVSLPDAVKTAENISGSEPVAARFFSDPNCDLLGYRVTMAGGTKPHHIYIDARSGEELPAARAKTF